MFFVWFKVVFILSVSVLCFILSVCWSAGATGATGKVGRQGVKGVRGVDLIGVFEIMFSIAVIHKLKHLVIVVAVS